MDSTKIPIPSELPQSPDPLNFIRQKVVRGIRRASVYQKYASIVFKEDPLLCTKRMEISPNFGYTVITWNLDLFEKIAEECREMGYLNVSVEKKFKEIGDGGYGASVNDRIVMYMSWDFSS